MPANIVAEFWRRLHMWFIDAEIPFAKTVAMGVSDGYKNKYAQLGASLMDFSSLLPDGGRIFHDVKDVSDLKKDAVGIKDLLQRHTHTHTQLVSATAALVPSASPVPAVKGWVMDNTSTNKRAMQLMEDDDPVAINMGCAAHWFNLAAKDFSKPCTGLEMQALALAEERRAQAQQQQQQHAMPLLQQPGQVQQPGMAHPPGQVQQPGMAHPPGQVQQPGMAHPPGQSPTELSALDTALATPQQSSRGASTWGHKRPRTCLGQSAQHQLSMDQQELQGARLQLTVHQQQLQDAQHQLALDKQQLQGAQHQLSLDQQQLKGAQHQLSLDQQQLQGDQHQLSLDQEQLKGAQHQLALDQQQLLGAKRQLTLDQEQLQGAQHQLALDQQQLQGAKRQLALDQEQLQGAQHQLALDLEQLQGAHKQLAQDLEQLQDGMTGLERSELLLRQQQQHMDAWISAAAQAAYSPALPPVRLHNSFSILSSPCAGDANSPLAPVTPTLVAQRAARQKERRRLACLRKLHRAQERRLQRQQQQAGPGGNSQEGRGQEEQEEQQPPSVPHRHLRVAARVIAKQFNAFRRNARATQQLVQLLRNQPSIQVALSHVAMSAKHQVGVMVLDRINALQAGTCGLVGGQTLDDMQAKAVLACIVPPELREHRLLRAFSRLTGCDRDWVRDAATRNVAPTPLHSNGRAVHFAGVKRRDRRGNQGISQSDFDAVRTFLHNHSKPSPSRKDLRTWRSVIMTAAQFHGKEEPTNTVTDTKRFTDCSVPDLHRMYKQEQVAAGQPAVSLHTFMALMPPWIARLSAAQRQVCVCKTCCNIKLVLTVLTQHKAGLALELTGPAPGTAAPPPAAPGAGTAVPPPGALGAAVEDGDGDTAQLLAADSPFVDPNGEFEHPHTHHHLPVPPPVLAASPPN
ncbi:hypothetical protein QJQ45_010585 [Haematococcus lacustris]|nr:hypothetical protein QJQ45_010585 [Haematococcus lacustris]